MKEIPDFPEPQLTNGTRTLSRETRRGFLVTASRVLGSAAFIGAAAAGATPPPSARGDDGPPRARIPDVIVVDQKGRRHRFFTDLIQGRLVLLNAMYTRCRGTCPMQATIFAQATRLLRERRDLRVTVLSVSLEPEVDTPEKLASFATRYDAGDDWLFLTGKPDDVRAVLDAMDLAAPRPEEHTPLCVVGHESSGTWMKMVNLTAPAEIVSRLEFVRERAAGGRRGK